jgi:hypothetical protein
MFGTQLGVHINSLVPVKGIRDQRRIQLLGIRSRKAAVPVPVPLHGCSYAVAISQVNVVSHSDFVAVIDDRCSRDRHNKPNEKFDSSSTLSIRGASLRRMPILMRAALSRAYSSYIIALDIRHHLTSIVRFSRKYTTASVWYLRRSLRDLDDRFAVLELERHKHSGHQRK